MASPTEDYIIDYFTFPEFNINIENIPGSSNQSLASSTSTQLENSNDMIQHFYEEECETSPDSEDIIIEEIDENDEDEIDNDNDENGYKNNNNNKSNISNNNNNNNSKMSNNNNQDNNNNGTSINAQLHKVNVNSVSNKKIKDDDENSESELTNLTWLTELKNITNLAPTDLPVTDPPTTRFNKFITQVRRSRESYENRCDMYRSNAKEKPPFNYAHIIAMAMLDEGRMTLKQICKWIQEKFAYYKVNKNWNNAIRHNLSLNHFFTKVARGKNEKGKGGYWELAMDITKSKKKRVRQRNKILNLKNSYNDNNITNANNNNNNYSNINNNNTLINNNNNNNTDSNNDIICNDDIDNNNENISFNGDDDDNIEFIHFDIINANATDICNDNNNSGNNTNANPEAYANEEDEDGGDEDDNRQRNSNDNESTPNDCNLLNIEVATTDEDIDEFTVNNDLLDEVIEEVTVADETTFSVDQIFTESEIPQPSNTSDIIVPYLFNSIPNGGPNVIVESIPFYFPQLETFDEVEFNRLINLNEDDLTDTFLNSSAFM